MVTTPSVKPERPARPPTSPQTQEQPAPGPVAHPLARRTWRSILRQTVSRRAERTITRWLTATLLLGVTASAAALLYRWLALPTVTVTDAVEAPVVEAFYATGTLSSVREYPVNSSVEGIVTDVWVDKGSPVAAGQKLAFVRVEEYLMRHSQAQAELELKQSLADPRTSPTLLEYDRRLQAAQTQLDVAQRELDRVNALLSAAAASQSDYDRAIERHQSAWSLVESIKAQKATRQLELQRDVKVAQAALDIAQWNLEEQAVRSPIDGVVLDRPVSTGTRVRVNDPLMHLAQVNPQDLIMRAAVDEEDKTRVSLDQPVHMTLYSYPQRLFEGRVQQIYPQADPNRRTFEVDIAVQPPDPGFAAGMTGELAFIVDSKDRATVIPTQAVQSGKVWVVREGRLAAAEVQLGLTSVERTEVVSGLSPGDRVVVSPARNLVEDQRVRTRYVDPATAAGLNKPTTEEGSSFRGFR